MRYDSADLFILVDSTNQAFVILWFGFCSLAWCAIDSLIV